VDSVIGIDLSGLSYGTKGQTALAQLSLEDPLRLVDVSVLPRGRRTDPELLRWIDKREPRVVAIDAPLSLPHSLTCTEVDCARCQPDTAEYLARDVDRKVGGMSTVMIAGIAFRGMYLARQLRDRGCKVIEVYPAAAYAALGLTTRSERRDPSQVAQILGLFVPGPALLGADERDALAAAIVAAAYARGTAQPIRGLDGTIWLPSA
jgi:predicted nuclease with RNAse H fold